MRYYDRSLRSLGVGEAQHVMQQFHQEPHASNIIAIFLRQPITNVSQLVENFME